MIGDAEAVRWAARFGVAMEQIRRDHLVSHVLAALPRLESASTWTFIGGTALARSHLDGLRVSEDIDLLVADARLAAHRLAEGLPALLRRFYPNLVVEEAVPSGRGLRTRLVAADVAAIEVQFIRMEPPERALDFERRAVALRYDGLPERVTLALPTRDSFVAMKLAAFRDRGEPRDLFDLAGLARLGALTAHAANLLGRLTGAPPQPREFRRLPAHTAAHWHDRLAHQTGDLMPAEEALAVVHEAIARLRPAAAESSSD